MQAGVLCPRSQWCWGSRNPTKGCSAWRGEESTKEETKIKSRENTSKQGTEAGRIQEKDPEERAEMRRDWDPSQEVGPREIPQGRDNCLQLLWSCDLPRGLAWS